MVTLRPIWGALWSLLILLRLPRRNAASLSGVPALVPTGVSGRRLLILGLILCLRLVLLLILLRLLRLLRLLILVCVLRGPILSGSSPGREILDCRLGLRPRGPRLVRIGLLLLLFRQYPGRLGHGIDRRTGRVVGVEIVNGVSRPPGPQVPGNRVPNCS